MGYKEIEGEPTATSSSPDLCTSRAQAPAEHKIPSSKGIPELSREQGWLGKRHLPVQGVTEPPLSESWARTDTQESRTQIKTSPQFSPVPPCIPGLVLLSLTASMSRSQWQREARPTGTLSRVPSHSPCQWNCSLSAWPGSQGRFWCQVCPGGLPWPGAAQRDSLLVLLPAAPCCCPGPGNLLGLLAAAQGHGCPAPPEPWLLLRALGLLHSPLCGHWELGQPLWLCCSALQGSAPLLPGCQLPSPGVPRPCRLQLCLHWQQ